MRLERFVANALNNNAAHRSEQRPSKELAQSLIVAGDVTVNGEVIRENGWHVFLGDGITCDRVHIRGDHAPIPQAHRLFVLHKPKLRLRQAGLPSRSQPQANRRAKIVVGI